MKTQKLKNNELYFVSMLHLAWKAFMLGAEQKIDTSLENHVPMLLDAYQNLQYFHAIAREMAGPEADESDVLDIFMANAPEMMHESWLEYKTKAGWSHGKVKDAELRTHPNMVSYDRLPPVEKKKDVVICMAYIEASNAYDLVSKEWT